MPYDEELAGRIRAIVAGRDGIREQKMFGGICFMAPGGMFAGVTRDKLMARVSPQAYPEAIARPGAAPMMMGERPMTGMVGVGPEGYAGDKLKAWVEEGYAFVQTLPAKAPRKPRAKRAAPRPKLKPSR